MASRFLGLPRIYWILWCGQFINRLGGFVLTFLPVYLTERLGYSDADAGLTLSLFGIGSLFGATLGGNAGDRYGRRPTILAFGLANAAVLLAYGASSSGAFIAGCALMHGLTNAYGPALSAAVSDVVAPEDRTRAYGYFYWAINLGFTFAAALGGALSAHGYHWLFIGDAVTTALFCGLVYLKVPETRPRVADEGAPRGAQVARGSALRDPRFVPFAVAQFVMLTVFLQSFVTMTLEERARGVSVRDVGLIAALNGAVIIVTQPAFVRATRGQPLWRALTLAGVLMALGAAIASRAHDTRGFMLAMVAFSLGEVAFSSAAPSYVAHVSPPDRRSSYQGAYSLCWGAASLIAPALGPAVRQRYGGDALWFGAAALALLSAVGHAVYTRRAERAEPSDAPVGAVASAS